MYLSKIYIKNFRGIKKLLVELDKNLNVIIGANGQLKTSLMDAIRLFYSWGDTPSKSATLKMIVRLGCLRLQT